MGRSNAPSRPPEYTLPNYVDENDENDTPTGQNPAAIRLLTSVEDSADQGS